MKNFVNYFLALLVFTLLPLNVNSTENLSTDSTYSFPFSNPYRATFLSSIVQPAHYVYNDSQLTLYPERNKLKLIGNRNRATYTISIAKDPKAPLLFIFPGLGGSAYSGEALFLADVAHGQGFSVVTLPSSSHWSFALAASKNGRIGYLPSDAEDMHQLLLEIRNRVVEKYKIQPSNYAVMGYSYGALDTIFAAASDLQHKDFNFKKVVMINPPMDREITTKKLDGIYEIGLSWPEKYREDVYTYAFGKIAIDMTAKIAMEIFSGQNMDWLKLSSTQLFWLVSKEFRSSLKDIIFSSQQIEDLGILKEKVTIKNEIIRENEAGSFSFANYLNQFVFPSVESETG